MKKIIFFWVVGLFCIVISSLYQHLIFALGGIILFFGGLYFTTKEYTENIYSYRVKQMETEMKENELVLGVAIGVTASIFVNSIYRFIEHYGSPSFVVDIVTIIFGGLALIFMIWFITKIRKH